MNFHKIDVDEEIWQFLKRNAIPFEDTPNSVLMRLLLGKKNNNHEHQMKIQVPSDFPNFPHGTPKALAQTLEVVYGVHKLGLSRTKATKIVAEKRRTDPQTIIDKYCRQLGKRAYEIDSLLESANLSEFQSLLEKKFTGHQHVIQDFFNSFKD